MEMEKKEYTFDLVENKILIGLLPFWSPLIPPIGMSYIKSYLEQYEYQVKTVDGNTKNNFKDYFDNYILLLRGFIPVSEWKEGNYFGNNGQIVMQNHLMAHINYTNKHEYVLLVKDLVYKSYYFSISDDQAQLLIDLLDDFYTKLESYTIELIEKEKPQVFGLTVYSMSLPASLYAFRLIKKRYPRIKTIMGGGIFADQLEKESPNYKYFLEVSKDSIDKIVIGEGEALFLKVLRDGIDSPQRVYTLKDINYEIIDIKNHVLPDYSDLDLSYYQSIPADASRSCPFQCKFCAETVNWGEYRKKDVDQIINDFKLLRQSYGFQMIWMCDSLLNPIASNLSKKCSELEEPMYWDGYLRASKAASDINNTLNWRKGGFYRARLGFESGSPQVLKLMDKKITVDMIKDTAKALADAGIKTTTYWLIGFPGETEEDFQQTLDLIEEIQDNLYEAMCSTYNYFLKGQVNSENWINNKHSLLYLDNAKEMLITETLTMNCEPSREVIFDRLRRFVDHCDKLKIPNPYSWKETYEADKRWKMLHKNAVPFLAEFERGKTVVEDFSKILNIESIVNQDTVIDSEFCF